MNPTIDSNKITRRTDSSANQTRRKNESGFSLIEAVVALTVFLIATLGVFVTFSYAVNYNAGNASRAQALSILQEQIEKMRSAKFTPGITDSTLTGGVKNSDYITAADGSRYKIDVKVDDDPFITGVQVNSAKTLKEITVTITLDRPTLGWQTAIPVSAILRRVRGN